jgi:hypothetical protein
MRRTVVALVVLSFALVTAGCGGGEPASVEGVVVAEGTASAEPTVVVDPSAPAPAVTFEEFPADVELTEGLASDIADKQPTVIFFYDGSQKLTNEVRAAVDSAMKANRGLATLHAFDVGKYSSVNSSGTVVLDQSDFEASGTAGIAAKLARALRVGTAPYILMTDDQGMIVFRHQGPVDAAFLEMHMGRLSE